ncbi:hypothetical protein [Bordetella sp. LUAb4]|uniref:hypothetical protein n=1 Tax=Bordetella sp. LUAb4 TaxID=2843195 RepID=UPI001E3CDD7B|nr:hypothetical protein [Bordetella sp. LUAb4]
MEVDSRIHLLGPLSGNGDNSVAHDAHADLAALEDTERQMLPPLEESDMSQATPMPAQRLFRPRFPSGARKAAHFGTVPRDPATPPAADTQQLQAKDAQVNPAVSWPASTAFEASSGTSTSSKAETQKVDGDKKETGGATGSYGGGVAWEDDPSWRRVLTSACESLNDSLESALTTISDAGTSLWQGVKDVGTEISDTAASLWLRVKSMWGGK